ncbi:MAG: hypothetical protein KatS3mg032_2564 [Cyclobacteriaceae bacterium]|nr:MAG: hypothetical protein KatS3mg032_2564 [Cyclobacteriaceae bacterium]
MFLVPAFCAFAQSKKSGQKTEATQPEVPTSLQPYAPRKDYSPESEKKQKRVKEQPITYNARERFYERMEEVARQRRKNEKLMAKPQYSDPMYFGHKRPPKKRPPEKMKYCKVCGIRH